MFGMVFIHFFFIYLYRYFCVHTAGVHGITVPLVSKLQNIEEENDDIGSYKEESAVDYLLCTNVSGSNTSFNEPLVPLGCSLINLSKNLFVLLGDELCNIQLIPRVSILQLNKFFF